MKRILMAAHGLTPAMYAFLTKENVAKDNQMHGRGMMRWGLIAVVVTLLATCASAQSPPQSTPSADIERDEAYARAVALEKETARRTVQLDRKLMRRLADERERQMQLDLKLKKGSARKTQLRMSEPRALVPRDEEQQLLEADMNINYALEGLYTTAWKNVSGEDELRAALLHWTVLVRRALMQDFHTRVPGLEKDPDCVGDIVGDGLLQRYFDAVLAHQETAAALALADLARQSACLGVDQSKQLASALVSTFEELRVFLRLHGHEDLVPYVVQAGSGPLLLFHDVEKYRGTDAPLSRWFREHRDILIEGVESGRQPARWHGLWLYDRRTGRLFGYKVTATPVDENDVNLSRFFASITTLENLGRANCSFAEMVERGMGPLGYFCAGSTCGRDTGGRRPIDAGTPSTKTGLEMLGLGAVEKTLDLTICGAADGQGDRSNTPKCGDDARSGNGSRAADSVRCLTKQVVNAGTEGFHCFGEAAGQCSNPLGNLVKNFQAQQMAGVKIGPACARSSGSSTGSGMGDLKAAEWEKERKEQLLAALDQFVKDMSEMVQKKASEASKAVATAREVEEAAKAAGRDLATEPIVVAAREAAAKAVQAKLEAHDAFEKALSLRTTVKDELKKLEKEREDKEKKAKETGGTKHCMPGSETCDDSCSAMSQAARDTLACVQAALSGEKKSPTRKPGSCDPTNCDPIEPSATAAGTLICFDAIGKEAGTAVSKHCWAMRCPAGQTPVGGANGCTCQDGGGGLQSTQTGGGMNDFCTKMLCSEGTPTYRDGHCTCSGDGGGGVGTRGGIKTNLGGYGGPIPKKMLPVLGGPSTYSDVRLGRP